MLFIRKQIILFIKQSFSKMKKLFIQYFDKLLVGFMALIGFIGCENAAAEYGTPCADYEIKGTVTDSITSLPVQNARVIVTLTKTYTKPDTTIIDTMASGLTDVTGKYDVQLHEFPLEEITFNVKVKDEDGPANGGDFATGEKEVLFKSTDLTGGNGAWYNGKATKIRDFKLKLK